MLKWAGFLQIARGPEQKKHLPYCDGNPKVHSQTRPQIMGSALIFIFGGFTEAASFGAGP